MAEVAAAPAPAASSTPAPAAPSNGASNVTQAPAPGVKNGGTAPVSSKPNGTPAPANGEASKPKPPPGFEVTADGKLKLKGLKVDGQESDAEYDEASLRRELQMARASQARLKEATQEKQRLSQAMAMMKQDPVAALQALGIDTDAALTQHLTRQAQLAALSDEQRQVLQARQEAQRHQKQAQQYEAQLQEHAVTQQWETQWRPALEAAFAEVGWTGDNEANLAAVAHEALMYERAGIDLPPRELVKLVDAEGEKSAMRWIDRAAPAAIMKLLERPQVIQAMQARVAAINAKRNPASGQFQGQPPPPAPVEGQRKEFISPEDMRARLLAKR